MSLSTSARMSVSNRVNEDDSASTVFIIADASEGQAHTVSIVNVDGFIKIFVNGVQIHTLEV